ncbi:MAG TPA: nodulation protein NfeD [Candidatus Limnocylindrales bacterium]
MSHHSVRRIAATALLAGAGLLAIVAPGAGATTKGAVVVLPAQGEVDSTMSAQLRQGLSDAADSQAAAAVIKLNTPGGTLTDMMSIVSAMLESRVPVIVWVAPSGGYAASAGTFITLAANLSYMAPGTRIGAAAPIDSNGQDIPGTLGDKVRNDAIAFMRSIAQTRNRPVEWAASTVSDAKSSSAVEAVAIGAVDGIAATIEEVVAQANGRTVQVRGQPVTLALAGAPIEELGSTPFAGLVGFLANPNVAFLLFTIGVLALLFELQNPGVLVGVFGLICLLLSVIGFLNLPTNAAGLVLIGIGLALFVLEPFIPSHGLLTIGGLIGVIVGGSILYNNAGPNGPDVRVAVPLLIVVAITGAVLGLLITTFAIRTRRLAAPLVSQPAAVPIGTPGQVRRPLTPVGSIYAVGEEWSARSADQAPLERGTPVRVVGTDGLEVVVTPDPAALP